MKKSGKEIKEILELGGNLILDAKDYNIELLKEFAKLLKQNRLIIKNGGVLSTINLKEIIKISPSNIIIEL